MTYKIALSFSLFSEKIEWNIRPNSVSKTMTWKFFTKTKKKNNDLKVESWDFWNYTHRFSQGSKDKFITMRSVKHGGKSWFERQGWSQWLYDNVNHHPSNPCETIKPFPLEKCGTSNVKIILILLHVSIKPRYFFNSRVVHIIKENILTSSIRCLQLGMSCRGIQLIKKLHELMR